MRTHIPYSYIQYIIFILLIVLFSVFIFPFTYAWTSYTHNWICDRAGLPDIDCASADRPAMQSQYKDINFRNHHCTNNSEDCSARQIADKYVLFIYPEAREFSAHLYADSMVPVHWYSTDYDTCHKIFEDKVEEKLRNADDVKYTLLGKEYDFSKWNLSMQCVAKYGKENRTVDLYVDDVYMDTVAKYVAEKMYVDVAPKESKEYDATPVFILLLILIMLVFVLFIYYGMKNSRK